MHGHPKRLVNTVVRLDHPVTPFNVLCESVGESVGVGVGVLTLHPWSRPVTQCVLYPVLWLNCIRTMNLSVSDAAVSRAEFMAPTVFIDSV